MAIIESFASFRDRAIQFGIDEADVSILKDKKFASFGAFTFIAIYNPNSADDATLKAALAHVLGRDITIEDMARFRRLHFESNAITISDAKRRTEATSEDTPKRVPAPERAARHNEQVRRLNGIMMTTAVEPSHALLDRVQQQLEENQAAYVTPELCTSRLQEINGVKKDKEAANTTIVEVGRFLKVSDKEPDQRTAISDSYALRQALRRRALAYDQTGLATFATLELWTERLYAALDQEPPPNYHYVSKLQIITADKEMWIRIIEKCRAGILPQQTTVAERATLIRPIDEALTALSTDPTILTFLAHLPKPTSQYNLDNDMNHEGENEKKRPRRENRGEGRAKHRGKGKGKGQGKGKGGKLPPALAGAWKTVKGQTPCQWYNLGKCHSSVAAGERCNQGLHACMGPGCGEHHPFIECPRQKKRGDGK